MKNFVLLIALITVLVSCNFNANRKSEIKQRIHELEQGIEKRSAQEIRDEAFLESAMTEYQNDKEKIAETESDKLLRLHTIIEPVTKRLDELQTKDSADQAEIDQLREEYIRY
ncbi:MAG: hypothetical protein K0S23_635 [Fluviicola sp.]|jgi:hypothetical protein|uniref:hypothetical protein n=1 Tax=Fluviicola sp. TaxID=1917219 RepID=UPI002631E3E0|nr:hypothetical protein [Fluviicola sp.]MDF3026328.1 hypothetical protein [Fluviicola sp.]